MALLDTISTLQLPPAPFHRLIAAFRSDVLFQPPTTWDDVLAYCHNSANPVGEIILHMDAAVSSGPSPSVEAINASNDICTALQITNFLQDVEVDAAMGRVYLPWSADESRKVAGELFERGSRVVETVHSWRLRQELKLIISAGHTAMKRTSHKELQEARLRKVDYLRIVLGLFTGRWRPRAET